MPPALVALVRQPVREIIDRRDPRVPFAPLRSRPRRARREDYLVVAGFHDRLGFGPLVEPDVYVASRHFADEPGEQLGVRLRGLGRKGEAPAEAIARFHERDGVPPE